MVFKRKNTDFKYISSEGFFTQIKLFHLLHFTSLLNLQKSFTTV